ncbi:MAG: tetratricopeptide repeat protein, partial [Bacteroidota bacterium]
LAIPFVLIAILTQKNANNPEFFYYLGKAQQRQFDYDNANRALHRAVALDSTHLRSIYLLGKYYVGVKARNNAHKILDVGLRIAPNDLVLINLKALVYYDNSDYEKAIPLLERLLSAGERKPFIYKKLGAAYRENGEFKKAKETFRNLSKIENEEADAYLGLAEIFMKEKLLDSAEFYFLKSIKERRYVFDNEYRNLGRIARKKGQLKRALDYYTKAWKEDTTNQFNYWQVCVMADEYYKDPATKLGHYEKLLTNYNNLLPFLKERAQKRVSELKEEIHFSKD